MAKHYLDFVGLNTFIYDPVGYDNHSTIGNETLSDGSVHYHLLNHIGVIDEASIGVQAVNRIRIKAVADLSIADKFVFRFPDNSEVEIGLLFDGFPSGGATEEGTMERLRNSILSNAALMEVMTVSDVEHNVSRGGYMIDLTIIDHGADGNNYKIKFDRASTPASAGTEVTIGSGVGTTVDDTKSLIAFDSGADGVKSPLLHKYKNEKFWPIGVPNTASLFPAMVIGRNGPYGFSSWKQIRVSENPLTRKQIKENVFTHVIEPGPQFSWRHGNKNMLVSAKYGDIERFDETPVTSRYRPIKIKATAENGTVIGIKSSIGNNQHHFNNNKLDIYYNFNNCESPEWSHIKNLISEDSINNPASPIGDFDYLKYSETIFPPATYTYKKYTRQRTNFSFNWRTNRANRTNVSSSLKYTNFTSSLPYVYESIWPLDVNYAEASADHQWETRTNFLGLNNLNSTYGHGSIRLDKKDFGILQNSYSRYSTFRNVVTDLNVSPDFHYKPGPLYFYHHMLYPSSSVVAPGGMKIEGINHGALGSDLAAAYIPSGETKWEAGDLRDILVDGEYVRAPRQPFFDTYEGFINETKQKFKDFSIIPEFRISQHIDDLLQDGLAFNKQDIFEITGGHSNTQNSSDANFYKIFSNSEFLKYFDVIKDEIDPQVISLTCHAGLKFLPYNGFYPAQRTVEMSDQFYDSYRNSIILSSSNGQSTTSDFSAQNILTPLFAPGLLFNTIKSGVACSYPLVDKILTSGSSIFESAAGGFMIDRSATFAESDVVNNVNVGGLNRDYYANWTDMFDSRVHFHTLYEPERISGKTFYNNVPHPSGNLSSSALFSGGGDIKYKMFAHNFLSETVDFFLRRGELTRIVSQPSNSPKFGNAISGSTYKMRVKMYKTSESPSGYEEGSSSIGQSRAYGVPQSTDTNENFTMYSRASAFGPPLHFRGTNALGTIMGTASSETGDNYAFTPPYYYGEAWADITFTPSETKKYTLYEIQNQATVSYFRHWATGSTERIGSYVRNSYAMHLDSSLNLLGKAVGKTRQVDEEEVGLKDRLIYVDSNSSNTTDARWIIQTKFETPILNFNHYQASSSVTLPLHGSQSVARGMWHQYGRIETDSSKGIFLQVEDIPTGWSIGVQNATDVGIGLGLGDTGIVKDRFGHKIESLKNLIGMPSAPKRLGRLADAKIIKEAVVAVPFVEDAGQRKFFKIPERNWKATLRTMVGAGDPKNSPYVKHIVELREKMFDYVFPPAMDFTNNRTIDPFAMYVFEFQHRLTQQDLSDIWQNLPPDLTHNHKEASSTIAHPLLAHHFLGGGDDSYGYDDNGDINPDAKARPLPDKIKWMVFKVKQRAKQNFYDKIVGEKDSEPYPVSGGDLENQFKPEGYKSNIGYNWPYDFFSMIELVKLDASVNCSRKPLSVSGPSYSSKTRTIGAENMDQLGQPSSDPEKTEVSRTYYSAAGSTQIVYDDGTTKMVAGDQT